MHVKDNYIAIVTFYICNVLGQDLENSEAFRFLGLLTEVKISKWPCLFEQLNNQFLISSK